MPPGAAGRCVMIQNFVGGLDVFALPVQRLDAGQGLVPIRAPFADIETIGIHRHRVKWTIQGIFLVIAAPVAFDGLRALGPGVVSGI